MRTPTWGEIERFCRIDGWRELRRTDHVFFEKVLADGTVLRTHRSFSGGKTISPGRFKAILRNQLQVSEGDFWAALKNEEPAARPSEPPAEEAPIPAYLVRVLKGELHLSEDEIAALSSEEAKRRVDDHWSTQ
ncbi:MAG: type II toxin-antitoxin system HicA family toxin [Actinobacteria bacterium]|nr:MAG: type II toxin-antitoxin system HicA family toxin [Actinomycetota bacterium]